MSLAKFIAKMAATNNKSKLVKELLPLQKAADTEQVRQAVFHSFRNIKAPQYLKQVDPKDAENYAELIKRKIAEAKAKQQEVSRKISAINYGDDLKNLYTSDITDAQAKAISKQVKQRRAMADDILSNSTALQRFRKKAIAAIEKTGPLRETERNLLRNEWNK